MKRRITYQETRQSHPAKSTVRGLRTEFDKLKADYRRNEADICVGVEGALVALRRGQLAEAEIILIALKALLTR